MIFSSYKPFCTKLCSLAAVFLSRLHVLPANVSAVGSFGFFGNPLLYLLSIIAFDVLVGGFYTGFWFTYLGFAMYPLLGLLAKKQPQRAWLLLPVASFLFFAISNFGSWYYFYPRTAAGFVFCYSLAIPFYARTVIGDLGFGYSYLFFKSARGVKTINAIKQSLSNQDKNLLTNK